MLKKSLSIILTLLMMISVFPLQSNAAILEEVPSGDSVSVTASAGEYVDVILSIDAVSNVQGLLMSFAKKPSVLNYKEYSVLTTSVGSSNVFVNPTPVGSSATSLIVSMTFPGNGVSFSKKTDLIALKYQVGENDISNLELAYQVREFYESVGNMNDIDPSHLSVRVQKATAAPTLSSLTLQAPTKTSYYVGDAVSTSGMKVTAVYSDNSTKDVTSDATVSGLSTDSAGTKTVTVSYGGKSATFNITVTAVTLSSIAVTTKPTKTSYFVGENFSSAGAVVTAAYNNGKTQNVTSNTTFSGFDGSKTGTQTITATYSGKTATFTVTVTAVTVSSLTLVSKPTKTTYNVGESFSSSGAKITATYNNGTTSDVTSSVTYSGFSSSSAGTKTITASYGGKSVTFTVTVTSVPLANDSTVSATSLALGKTLTINGVGSGGTGGYSYEFYYKKSSATSWSKFGSAYVTGSTAKFTPSVLGTYNVKVIVKDSSGKTASKEFSVKFSYEGTPLVNTSSVSATSLDVGKTVTLTGAATGGKGTYSYQFFYKKYGSSDWSKFSSAYVQGNKATLTPSSAGTFYVKSFVKDGVGNTQSKVFTVSFNKGELENNSTVNVSYALPGKSITVNAVAAGGTLTYTYEFYYMNSNDSDWTAFPSSKVNGKTATFTQSATGKYYIRVYVKDTSGKSVRKTLTVNYVNSIPELVNKTTLSRTTAKPGDSVKISGAASGGAGTYKYEFYFKRSTSDSWSKFASSYVQGTTATFVPSATGTYYVRVYVKDDAGNTTMKTLTVNCVSSIPKLVNNTTLSASTAKVGTSVTVKGAASGGAGVYQYEFYFKKSTSDSWSKFSSSYVKGTTATFGPSSAGTYYIKVYVKDGAGTTEAKTLTVNYTK